MISKTKSSYTKIRISNKTEIPENFDIVEHHEKIEALVSNYLKVVIFASSLAAGFKVSYLVSTNIVYIPYVYYSLIPFALLLVGIGFWIARPYLEKFSLGMLAVSLIATFLIYGIFTGAGY